MFRLPPAIIALLFLGSGAGFSETPVAPARVVPVSTETAHALGKTFADVAEKVSLAVVVITAVRGQEKMDEELTPNDQMDPNDLLPGPQRRMPMPREPESQGSGFIVRADGYIYTNNHVIQGAEKIRVRLKDGRSFDARVVGVPDEKTDVAVIKINATNLPVAELGNSDTIRPGEWTIAIGAPFNLDYSVTVGVLSGKVRDRIGAAVYEEYLQTQATINPGNSGGPLLDIDGRVIGINTLIRTRPGFSFYNANVGFAIPINLARKVGEDLMTKGKVERPWLGIDIRSLAEENEEGGYFKGMEKGVLVKAIRPDTPAYKSGLKPGDVITAIDDISVNTARELQKQVLEKKIDQSVRLKVIRDGKVLKLDVKTGLQPSLQQIAGNLSPRNNPHSSTSFGLTVQPLTPEVADQFGLGEKQGLLITDVDEGSPSARAGLQPGMVITEVDGRKVLTGQALKEALSNSDPKKGALVQISRDRIRTYVILRPGPANRSEGK
jgi:Do/DeqQ family serine protease